MSLNQPSPEESTLIAALERKPAIAIPADFHLQLRASIAAEPPRRATPQTSFARTTAHIAAVCLAIVLAILTVRYPNAIQAPESMMFILELILVAQLMAVGWWLGVRREM
jgi:hypothetical protein